MIYTSQPPSMAYGYASPASPWWPYAKYPDLHRGRVAGYCPSLGNTADRLWDFEGNGNHGTMMPTFATGPSWVVSEGKYANSFDGVNDYTSQSISFDFNSPFTVSFWNKRTASGIHAFVSNWRLDAINGVGNHGMFIEDGGAGKLRFAYRNNGTSVFDFSQTNGLPLAAWCHIVARYAPGESEASVWINGRKQSVTASATSTHSITGRPLLIASLEGVAGIGRYVLGQMDDIQLFDRPLSQNEITQLYQLGRGGSYAIDYEMMIAEQVAAFKAYWARRTTVIIGGGVS